MSESLDSFYIILVTIVAVESVYAVFSAGCIFGFLFIYNDSGVFGSNLNNDDLLAVVTYKVTGSGLAFFIAARSAVAAEFNAVTKLIYTIVGSKFAVKFMSGYRKLDNFNDIFTVLISKGVGSATLCGTSCRNGIFLNFNVFKNFKSIATSLASASNIILTGLLALFIKDRFKIVIWIVTKSRSRFVNFSSATFFSAGVVKRSFFSTGSFR